MKKSIGFDVSKANIDVAVFDGQNYQYLKTENSRNGFEHIVNTFELSPDPEISITMEATGTYHRKAADYFCSNGYTVHVVNPLKIKRYSGVKFLRAKTDKIDSKIIALYGFNEKEPVYKLKPEKRLKIQGFLNAIDNLCQMRTQLKNRIEALNQHTEDVEDIRLMFNRMITSIQIEIVRMEKEVSILSQEISATSYCNVLTIPGVGTRMASAMIGYFGAMEDFEKSKQLVSFIGISPFPKESGSSIHGRGSISRMGNNYLRKQLFMASLSASRYNSSCKKLYDRLISNGKAKKIALIAVSNKLARQIFAVIKYGRKYDPNFGIFCQNGVAI